MDPQQTFPFMKLPTEIRLMVYECIPVQVKVDDFATIGGTAAKSRNFAVVSKHIDLSILLTCRNIHYEASAIMQKKLNDILATPPRWIIDLSHNSNIHKWGGPLWHMSRHLAKQAVKNGKSLGLVPYITTGMGASASSARFPPESDPRHAKLSQLTQSWFRNLDHQRKASDLAKDDACPTIEIAFTAPENCSYRVVLQAVFSLAGVLFAESGGFQFALRKASHLYPLCTEEMLAQEKHVMMRGCKRPGVVRAVQGHNIEAEEYERQWSEGGYY
jgi:hypothetical protein